jgi:methylenetetrahydrofolate dehydrogenase (NADP+)/methenyltetrahydrofolate cyclohydrolase
MTRLLFGKAISDAKTPLLAARAEALREKGTPPTLAIVRVGERDDDIAYERSVIRKADSTGVTVRTVALDIEITEDELITEIEALAEDDCVHGILIFLPLPGHIDKRAVISAIPAGKDVDGVTAESMAAVYEGRSRAGRASVPAKGDTIFAPCTAEAVIAILDHYGINSEGKSAIVIGRSTVIGKPVSMLLLDRSASVTICHSKTADLKEKVREADIVVACAGLAKDGPRTGITRDYLREGQTVIDVAIHTDTQGNLYGDVDAEAATTLAANYTPVPGGVGGVTTLILLEHLLRAAENNIIGQ